MVRAETKSFEADRLHHKTEADVSTMPATPLQRDTSLLQLFFMSFSVAYWRERTMAMKERMTIGRRQ